MKNFAIAALVGVAVVSTQVEGSLRYNTHKTADELYDSLVREAEQNNEPLRDAIDRYIKPFEAQLEETRRKIDNLHVAPIRFKKRN